MSEMREISEMGGKKRGRPAKGGVKPGNMLIRAVLVIGIFGRLRREGAKYSAAVEATVNEMRSRFPSEPISATEVKRVLADFQPPDEEVVFLVDEEVGQNFNFKLGLPFRERVNSKNRKKKKPLPS